MTQHSPISRRDLLKLSACGTFGTSLSSRSLAATNEPAPSRQQHRSVILLWMTGGPSQIDTFDMKPGHENGGPFRPIDTSVSGIQICEHLPQLAQLMHHCVPIRSMSTPETDHVRATHHLRTGSHIFDSTNVASVDTKIRHTTGINRTEVPRHVALAPYARFNSKSRCPEFLGPKPASVVVGEADRPGVNPDDGLTKIDSSDPAVRTELLKAFNLAEEKTGLRNAYGRNQFGQACLMARRLVERGVAFVDVSLNDVGNKQAFAWDTHADNFRSVEKLLQVLDPAWSTLILDLKDRGLLDSTQIVWMGEFGRSPQINAQAGRDHFPNAWTTVLCGGGIQGGQTVGKTSPDGMTIVDRPVSVQELFATIDQSLHLDVNRRPSAAANARPLAEIV